MIKEKLSLLNDKPNVFDFPQSTIDPFMIPEEDKEIFLSTVKIFASKSKNHFTSKYVNYHVKTGMKFFDVVRLPKYPLFAAYNKTTKRCVINLSAIGRKSISNIDMRDMYTIVVYSHVCSVLSAGISISAENADPFAEYMIQVLLKIFAKKHGFSLTGPYVDLIPQFRFIVAAYIYASFFGVDQETALNRAGHLAKIKVQDIKVDFSNYDLSKVDSLIMALSESGVLPGLNKYSFLDIMIRNFGTMNICIFEDVMRFSSTMISASINGNSYFSPSFQMYNQKLFLKVNSIIEATIDKAI